MLAITKTKVLKIRKKIPNKTKPPLTKQSHYYHFTSSDITLKSLGINKVNTTYCKWLSYRVPLGPVTLLPSILELLWVERNEKLNGLVLEALSPLLSQSCLFYFYFIF